MIKEVVFWLEKRLADRAVLAATILKEAAELGFSEKTVRRAKIELQAQAYKTHQGNWVWFIQRKPELPEEDYNESLFEEMMNHAIYDMRRDKRGKERQIRNYNKKKYIESLPPLQQEWEIILEKEGLGLLDIDLMNLR